MLHHTVTYTINGARHEYRAGFDRSLRLTDRGLARLVAQTHAERHATRPVSVRDVSILRVEVATLAE